MNTNTAWFRIVASLCLGRKTSLSIGRVNNVFCISLFLFQADRQGLSTSKARMTPSSRTSAKFSRTSSKVSKRHENDSTDRRSDSRVLVTQLDSDTDTSSEEDNNNDDNNNIDDTESLPGEAADVKSVSEQLNHVDIFDEDGFDTDLEYDEKGADQSIIFSKLDSLVY